MMFIQRRPATFFHPFFAYPEPEAYIFVRPGEKATANCDDAKTDAEKKAATSENRAKTIRYGRNVNLMEDKEAWTIMIDMPGVKAEHVEVEESNGRLTVTAERKTDDTVTAKYRRVFGLDPRTTDAAQSSADLSDGVLTVVVPKKDKPDPVVIEVVSADAPEIAKEDEDKDNSSKEFRYTFELPGVKASGVKVEFHDGTLRLEAERKKGRFTTSFQRAFTVGESIDMEHAKAYLMDGIFTLMAPRKEVVKPEPRKIAVGKSSIMATQDEEQEIVFETADKEAEAVVTTADDEENDDEEYVAINN